MIKYLVQSDLDEYLDLLNDSFKMSPEVHGGIMIKSTAAKHFNDVLKSEKSEKFILGYWDEGELIGMIEFCRGQLEKNKHSGEISELFVHPGYRKKGVGKQLIFESIKNAKVASRIKVIFLRIMEGNSGPLSLVEKVGFHEYGIKPKAFKNGDNYLNEILMFLEI